MRFRVLAIFTMVWGGPAFGQATVPGEMEPKPKWPLAFHETFDEPTEKWEFTDKKAWKRYKAGPDAENNFVLGLMQRKSDYQPKYRSPHNIALVQNLTLTDFDIRFRVRSTLDTGAHRDCCIFFCHQNSNQFYYIHAGARPDPHSGQIMIVNDAPRTALTDNKNPIPWDDRWHRVRVTRDSATGEIALYFDDWTKPVMQVVDQSFSEGRIGIGSFDDRNEFDDIRIYGR